MKQTAVEWLDIEIKKQIFQCETQWQCGYQKALNEVVFLLKQTKEMEKQQRQKDFKAGNDSACMEHENIEDYFKKYIKEK